MTKGKGSEKTCEIRGHTFRHDMSKSKVKAYRVNIEKAIKVTENRLDAFAEAWAAGDQATCDQLTHELLTCKKSKVAGAMRYAMKQPLDRRPTLEQCVSVPQRLDMTKPIKERAFVFAQEKLGKDDWRPIADFGLQHRTAQHMVKPILERTFVPRSFQKGQTSVHKAVARIRKQADAGNHFFVHQDIVNFFLHFEAEKLKVALPLPTWAVEHVVVGRRIDWAVRKGLSHYEGYTLSLSIHSLISAAHRGIPQGSSCSTIVAEIEVSRLQVSKALEQALSNWADDFLSLHATQQDAESAAEELEEAVAQLPGGNFNLKTKSMGHLSQGCEFIGHQFRLDDGNVRISPSPENQARLTKRFHELQDECGVFTSFNPDKKKVLQAAANCASYLSSFSAVFAECDDLHERFITHYAEGIQEMLDKVHATKADLADIPATEKFKLKPWPVSPVP